MQTNSKNLSYEAKGAEFLSKKKTGLQPGIENSSSNK